MKLFDEKPSHQKKVTHKIGYCVNCGWTHAEIRRVRVDESGSGGSFAVIKPVCVECLKGQRHQVICNLCGRVECDNLYPVSVMRRQIDEQGHTCNLFLHLCAECRGIPHEEVLKRMNVPDMCETCKDRFLCFTNKGQAPAPSRLEKGVLEEEKTQLHKRRRIFWR